MQPEPSATQAASDGAWQAMVSRDDFVARDESDPLSSWRDRFLLPDDLIYLDGNSLGAMPGAVVTGMSTVLHQEWGPELIRSWQDADWIGAPARVGGKIARLVGARADEVIVADSTSINIYKLLFGALNARPDRRTVLMSQGDFPTDHYVADGLVRALRRGHTLRCVPADALESQIDSDTAVVLLTHVNYRTGQLHDMAGLTRAAHGHGSLVLWDLSHSAGAVPLALDDWDVDLAVGCCYKYLNGGPGAPAFMFVRSELQEVVASPLTGWMGHADPFAFADGYTPANGMKRYLCGAPVILGVRALEAALDVWADVSIADVRAKSIALTESFIERVEERVPEFRVVSPRDPDLRGSQVTLQHPHARDIVSALADRRVLTDFRPPDLVRFGFAPLYVRFTDAWDAVEHLGAILVHEEWRAKQDAPQRFVP